MAVLPRDEFFNRIKDTLGNDTSEESITFLEDMTDTYNDLEKKANGDGIDWEQKYKENDEAWRKKYQHRFFSGGGVSNSGNGDDCGGGNDEGDNTPKTIDDLFK